MDLKEAMKRIDAGGLRFVETADDRAMEACIAAARRELERQEKPHLHNYDWKVLPYTNENGQQMRHHICSCGDSANAIVWKKPKRASLEEMESALRLCRPLGREVVPAPMHVAAADILKALREVVVPWLRELDAKGISHMTVPAVLRALGEEP